MSPTKAKSPTKTHSAPRRTATPAGAGGAPAPELTPEQGISAPLVDGAATTDGPTLQPPGTEAAGLQAMDSATAIGAVTSATIGGLYTTNNQCNAWAYLNGVGWRRLSPANVGAHHAMLQIARLAKDGGIAAQCEEDGSVIHAIYLW